MGDEKIKSEPKESRKSRKRAERAEMAPDSRNLPWLKFEIRKF